MSGKRKKAKLEKEEEEDEEEVEVIDFTKIDKTEWYAKTKSFWDASSASDIGMLGGLGNTAIPDVQGSKKYLNKVFKSVVNPIPSTRCLDVGAGVGRVTEGVLLKKFHTVDIQDQSDVFINQALHRLSSFSSSHRLNNHFIVPLQEFIPLENYYDCIWIQWVIGYLEPNDMIKCLNRMCAALKNNNTSYVIVKENVVKDLDFYRDKDDNYIIRTENEWVALFNQSLLYVKSFEQQMNMPKGIFPVYFFLLKQKEEEREKEKGKGMEEESEVDKEKETETESKKEKEKEKEQDEEAGDEERVELVERKKGKKKEKDKQKEEDIEDQKEGMDNEEEMKEEVANTGKKGKRKRKRKH